MPHWKELVLESDEELARRDIAEVNLACAVGLPTGIPIDFDRCREKLDFYARRVKAYTEPRLPRFRRKRHDYHNSEAYFRVLAMITVLQRDLGVRYNPEKIPEDVPLAVEDSFVHGVLFGAGGTCASMPVVDAAVGRRLGYPLKLVHAIGDFGHTFCRWDEPGGERFNIEAAGLGLSCLPDEHYTTGRYVAMAKINHEACGLMRSLTPKEDLAFFLKDRACHFHHLGNDLMRVESYMWAVAAAPHLEGMKHLVNIAMEHWQAKFQPLMPPGSRR